MPHIVLEHSANIREAVAQTALLDALSEAVLAQRDAEGAEVYPLLGLRARAISYDEFRVADGAGAYGFAHVTIKIGAGRSEAIERATAAAAFAVLRDRLAAMPDVILALSATLERFNGNSSFKYNGIRERLGERALAET